MHLLFSAEHQVVVVNDSSHNNLSQTHTHGERCLANSLKRHFVFVRQASCV